MSTADTIGVLNDVAQFLVAVVAIVAVGVALKTSNKQIEEARKQQEKQINASNDQLAKQIEESRRLATEERQHQSCPIIVPTKEIDNILTPEIPQQHFYTAEAPPLKGNIGWALQFPSVPLAVSNIGMGPAFNIHCILHGSENIAEYQFISWNNGPIGAGKDETLHLRHPRQRELRLDRNDSVDGKHPLYYPSAGPNPNQALASLTVTYHDLFGNKLVSIFDYTPYHEWVRVFISMPSSPKFDLDLKELNDQKKP